MSNRPSATRKSKYTFEYEPQIETLLDNTLTQIRKDISSSSSAPFIKYLVLGGGYGRGEGGILKISTTNPSLKLYNDLDFFVITHPISRKQKAQINLFLSNYASKWHNRLGIDVDFSKAYTSRYIRNRRNILMWREMILGSILVIGDEKQFKKDFLPLPIHIAPSEIGKLLMNRVFGLFLAHQKLQKKTPLTIEERDFIAKNINKALLACTDAILIANNLYTFKTKNRLQNLSQLQGKISPSLLKNLQETYSTALTFKQNPIFFEKNYYIIHFKNTLKLCKQVIDSLQELLYTLKYLNLAQKLKSIKQSLLLRKSFTKLKIKNNPFLSPYIYATIGMIELMILEEPISHKTSFIYRSIWKQLN